MWRAGEKFTEYFKRFMPDSFVFALTLTILTAVLATYLMNVSIMETLQGWYKGFWLLLEFGMQVILILVTGYTIALSPIVRKNIVRLTGFIQSPKQVYPFILFIGMLLSLISWSWMVITAVLAREFAKRIRGINYPYLIACVFFSGGAFVSGLSSTIPLLLNTQNNFLINSAILSSTIPVQLTLGSYLNIAYLLSLLLFAPLIAYLLAPQKDNDLQDMLSDGKEMAEITIKEESQKMMLSYKVFSDSMNNSIILQFIIGFMGLSYIIYHFATRGLDLNLNIMIFIFLIIGLFLHKTPVRYGIAMERASTNVSGIIFQYPFYAGIMGIMMYTGLGEQLAEWMASIATENTYPFLAFFTGSIVNFAIPSAGGEFAVIGPSILHAVKEIGEGLPASELNILYSRASLSVAYGESITNAINPFFLLIILPIMGEGIKIQARDVMGYLIIPFLTYYVIAAALVTWMPIS